MDNFDVKIFADKVEAAAIDQIKQLLSVNVFSNSKIRIMPDVHPGAGCVIGFTGDLGERVIPNVVGVDIGCGILVQPIGSVSNIDFHALNEYILHSIPSGRNFRDEKYLSLPQPYMESYLEAKEVISTLLCYRELKEIKRLSKSIGTLGGGNHFIEINKDDNEHFYLVIHTGSRNLGKQVAQIYQKLAVKCQSGWDKLLEEQNRLIDIYKQAGRKSELHGAIQQLHASFKMHTPPIPADLCYLEGGFREDYLHDMRLCQRWAQINRRMIADLIVSYFVKQGVIGTFTEEVRFRSFESVHNYISDENIIRKGAISAKQGERCIIPLNMRDGSLICVGKGNGEWNFSAPHGAGRVMSRSKAFKEISIEDFRQSMNGIYSETVSEDTKDESPMVYKPKDEIIRNIQGTVEIEKIIKPVFNFKAAE